MKDSAERIQFISDYLSLYEKKITLLNSKGLFDCAKLFELFALEVSNLLFNQKFNNLNDESYNYPCVDLISEDKQTYIQVSTVKDLPAKIKYTLEKIKDSKNEDIKTISQIKFFVLNNESVDKVIDYTGNNQIGNISFVKKDNLITTSDILDKANTDLTFQIALYDLLKKEADSIKDNSTKLYESIEESKSLLATNIDYKINNEYEIDRSELINKITSAGYKYVCIQGNAGSGKSALCKKLIEEEPLFIYARAERLLEETTVNDIWGVNIRQVLEYLGDKSIVIFIDALEFIADCPTKLDLLQIIYEITRNCNNVKIITSYRTSDASAFIKLENNFSIHSYEIPDLTGKEISKIAEKYSLIKKLVGVGTYTELLKSPLYVNLIIEQIHDLDSIADESDFRDYVWQKIICLNDKKIKDVINSIVFNRAQNFTVGILTDKYESSIIKKLLSKGILVQNDKTVRLKYDVFEDICFEQYLDEQFDNCKGDYGVFFEEITKFGRCIYRRYQIWIENKLFAKDNREKFLYELLFSTKMPSSWKEQTEIGIVKSRYCSNFFEEYGKDIIKSGLIYEFVKITNLYAFKINYSISKLIYLSLNPSGEARACLINIITENKIYEKWTAPINELEKICIDYSKNNIFTDKTAIATCTILIYFIEKFISEPKDFYKLDGTVNSLLSAVYKISKFSKDWITTFWHKMEMWYKTGSSNEERFAEEIIEFALKFDNFELAHYLPKELCKLAEMYWTWSIEDKRQKTWGFYNRDDSSLSYQYGLSEKAEHYEMGYTHNTAITCNFFYNLFTYNFWDGLNWMIDFVNKAVNNFSSKIPNGLPLYNVYFVDSNITKGYYGFERMWMAIVEEHSMPLIISDLIFCFKIVLSQTIQNDAVKDGKTLEFANNVKKYIYEKSNNIALLSVISFIGMEFEKKLPAYTLDLVSNIDIVLFDLHRFAILANNPATGYLEKQILLTVGIPFPLKKRYENKIINKGNLRSYCTDIQIYGDSKIKEYCYKVLDYLYTIISNDAEHAAKYLQIQNMDLRNAKVEKVNDNTVALRPQISGESAKVVSDYENTISPQNAVAVKILNGFEKLKINEYKLEDCLEVIQLIQSTKNCILIDIYYNKNLIELMSLALRNEKLDNKKREEFCSYWINGINQLFLANDFHYNYELSTILFVQLDADLSDNCKKDLKKLIFDLIIYSGTNGIINEIRRYAKQYLLTNTKLSQAMFNTLVEFAKDEMSHQKFNSDYCDNHKKIYVDKPAGFLPNSQPHIKSIDQFIPEAERYENQREKIIDQYLYKEADLDLPNFEIKNYDIANMLYAINCLSSLDEKISFVIVKQCIQTMINIWDTSKHNAHDIITFNGIYEIQEFLQRELINDEIQRDKILEILFDDIDFSKFTTDTIDFYNEIFGSLLAYYFDAYNDKIKRQNCEHILYALEKKISTINNERIKVALYKSLTFTLTRLGGGGDWSECKTSYSYHDMCFLNEMFSKYGEYHLKELFDTIYKLHIEELLPQILLSIRDAMQKAPKEKKYEWQTNSLTDIVKDQKNIIMILITKSYFDFNAKIKKDKELIKAFEDILIILKDLNYEEATLILDEFRIH